MNPIETFYAAFTALDAEKMAACYHDEVVFEDPAFGRLQGERARNMWRMLCHSQQGKDFRVWATHIAFDGERGTATWEAVYTFSATGRRVHNRISAQFVLKDGKILTHTDTFSLRKWAAQALGVKGYLLGGTGFFRKRLHAQTNRLLDRFEAQRAT